jgi:hypothetical protein
VKSESPRVTPTSNWLNRTQLILEELKPVEPRALRRDVSLLDRQQAFGYTQEDTRILMSPMATTGQEAIGSMGTDTPISAMSKKSKLLYTYFKQNFAQVTNPPIDPIREELVMSLVSFIGPRPNILDHKGASKRKRMEVRQPILTNGDLEKIRSIGHTEDLFDTKTLDFTYDAEKRRRRHGSERSSALCDRAEAAVTGGYNIIVLSDRQIGPDRIAIPALLATAAVHHHLIRKGLRTSVGLVVESGEPREVHHFCCLAGYGAEAINPYLAFDTLTDMHKRGEFPKEVEGQRGRLALHQGDRQGHAEGHVQDGHLDLPVLLRRADLRRGRSVQSELREKLFLRHGDDHRRRRPGRDRGRNPPAPRSRPSVLTRCLPTLDIGGEYVSHARRRPCLDAGCRRHRCSMQCAVTARIATANSPNW